MKNSLNNPDIVLKNNERTSSERQLAYTAEMKREIRKNPGIVKAFFAFQKELESLRFRERQEARVTEPFVYRYGDITVSQILESRYLAKVDLNDVSLFVKTREHRTPEAVQERRSDPVLSKHRGYQEFQDSMKARDLLKDLSGVRVIDFMLGFSSKESDYFVSKYEDLDSLVNVFSFREVMGQPITDIQYERLEQRFEEILLRLSAYTDLDAADMLYDPEKDEIVVADLVEDSTEFPTI